MVSAQLERSRLNRCREEKSRNVKHCKRERERERGGGGEEREREERRSCQYTRLHNMVYYNTKLRSKRNTVSLCSLHCSCVEFTGKEHRVLSTTTRQPADKPILTHIPTFLCDERSQITKYGQVVNIWDIAGH